MKVPKMEGGLFHLRNWHVKNGYVKHWSASYNLQEDVRRNSARKKKNLKYGKKYNFELHCLCIIYFKVI